MLVVLRDVCLGVGLVGLLSSPVLAVQALSRGWAIPLPLLIMIVIGGVLLPSMVRRAWGGR